MHRSNKPDDNEHCMCARLMQRYSHRIEEVGASLTSLKGLQRRKKF